MMTHLFRPTENTQMTFRRIISLLKRNFGEDGSNERLYLNKVYNVFVKYLREAGSKYFVFVVVAVVLLLVDVFEDSFPFLYPLKASENLKFLDLCREYRKRRLTWNGLSKEELNRQARDLATTLFICKTYQHSRSSTSIVFCNTTRSFDNI